MTIFNKKIGKIIASSVQSLLGAAAVLVHIYFSLAHVEVDFARALPSSFHNKAKLFHIVYDARDIGVFFAQNAVAVANGGHVYISHFMRAVNHAFANLRAGAIAVLIERHNTGERVSVLALV